MAGLVGHYFLSLIKDAKNLERAVQSEGKAVEENTSARGCQALSCVRWGHPQFRSAKRRAQKISGAVCVREIGKVISGE